MNGKALGQKVEAGKPTTRVNRVPEKVRAKLKTFTVKDNQGDLVGQVRDVYFDAKGQLNFVVAGKNRSDTRIFLLSIKLLKKVNYHQKTLFVNLNSEQIEMLPGKSVNYGQNNQVAIAPVPQSEFNNNPFTNTSTVMLEPASVNETMKNQESAENEVELDIVDREVIRLLEERLVINRSKRKVGEVIVRKEIETRMVEVPLHREKLIVEQVGEDPKVLAEIDLGEGEITGIELSKKEFDRAEPTVRAEFTSVTRASKMLNSIAAQQRHGCAKVRIELVLEDKQLQETYQTWIDNYSDS
ncbi:MAG: PRC-barrel domain-containing protein [Microcoleus sp.]